MRDVECVLEGIALLETIPWLEHIEFSLEDAINRFVTLALRQTNNNVSAAARLLGVTRDFIRYRLQGGRKDRPVDQSPDRPSEN